MLQKYIKIESSFAVNTSSFAVNTSSVAVNN